MEEGGGCRVGFTGYTGCNSKEGRGGGVFAKGIIIRGGGGIRASFQFGRTGCVSTNFFPHRFCASSEIERRCEMFICFVAAIGSDKCEEDHAGRIVDCTKKNVQPEEFSGQLSLGESSFFLSYLDLGMQRVFLDRIREFDSAFVVLQCALHPPLKNLWGKEFPRGKKGKIAKIAGIVI